MSRRDVITPNRDFSEFITSFSQQSGTLVVDAEYGNNTTAEPNSRALAYATISAAKADMQDGDKVVVLPGTYNERDLAKTGGTFFYHFEPGAIVQYAGTGVGGLFDDTARGANGSLSLIITGSGIFRLNATHTGTQAVNNGAFNIENASSEVYIEAVDISNAVANNSAAQRCGIYISNGRVVANVKRRISCERYDAVIQLGGTLHLTFNDIYTPNSTGGDGIEWAAGNCYLKGQKINTYGSCINAVWESGAYVVVIDCLDIEGEALALEGNYPDDLFYVRATRIASRTQHAVETSGGKPEIIGATIFGGSDTEAVSLFLGDLKLRDCKLVADGSATESITGSGNLYIYGSLDANKAKAAGVTVAYGAFPTADTDVS